MSEEKYAASIGTKAKQIVLNIFDYFRKDVKSSQRFRCTVHVLREDPTKITITNASIDKQKNFES